MPTNPFPKCDRFLPMRKASNRGPMRFALFVVASSVLSAAELSIVPPESVVRCLQQQKSPLLELDEGINPVFIRGDLDGDGIPDHAVAIKATVTGRLGMLLCGSKSGRTLFSAGTTTLPDGLKLDPDESLSAVGWTFITRVEARRLSTNAETSRAIRGEAILLQYERDRALIFWDGSKYRWLGWFQ